MTSTVLVTGPTSGLGLAASTDLAAQGWHVVLGTRSLERGEQAVAQIRARVPGASLEAVTLDLASLDSVRSAAQRLADGAGRPPLRAVVCNAGIQVVSGVQRTQDGYELTFGTNHLGHFLLIRLLLDHLVEPARIVLVSSATHRGGIHAFGFPRPRWTDPHTLADASYLDDSPTSGRIRYGISKLANVYTTYELARRLEGRAITVNAFDPGLMPETALGRDYPARAQRIYRRLAPVLARVIPKARTVARSGADLAWLITAPELAGMTGSYFVSRRRRRTSPESYDRARAAQLWEVSDQLASAPSRR